MAILEARALRHLARLALALVAAGSLAGCSERPAGPDTARLGLRYPAQAREILGSPGGFAATAGGFVAESAGLHTLSVALPSRAEEPVGFRLASGFGVRVREVGAWGAAARAGSAVAYSRPGGTSYWTSTGDGYEEWLELDGASATSGEPAAAWQIDGAVLSQHGSLVELRDEAGIAWIRVRAPRAYAVSGRLVDTALSVRGNLLELRVASEGEAVLVDPAWSTTGAMATAREAHAAVLLPTGKVLVAGGFDANAANPTAFTSAELYDPDSKTWSTTAVMGSARYQHTLTMVGGQALAAGGNGGAEMPALQSTESFDPVGMMWNESLSLNSPRFGHVAVPISAVDGQILFAGGSDGMAPALSSGEVWMLDDDSQPIQQQMSSPRLSPAAVLLPDGTVLICGGSDGMTAQASADVFSTGDGYLFQATNTPMSTPRVGHTATLLPDGRVLVVGGTSTSGEVATAELYDYTNPNQSWSAAAPMASARTLHTATLLPNGQVLVAGGSKAGAALQSSELYDPVHDTWTDAGGLVDARDGHIGLLLPNGGVLVAGGAGASGPLASAEVYAELANGATCDSAADCASAFCVNKVCAAGLQKNGATCDSAADCQSSLCVQNVCAAGLLQDGAKCQTGAACQSGFCADSVCCDTACAAGACDACSVAAGATTDGTCALLTGPTCDDGDPCTQTDTCNKGVCEGSDPKVCAAPDLCHEAYCEPATGACALQAIPGEKCDNGTCGSDGDCPTGQFCVDAVCCDSACKGPCESCALEGSVGKCTQEPTGVDLRHACGPEESCLSTCGPAGTCIGAGKGTQCKPSECTDATHGVGPAYCPSEGASCPVDAVLSFDCGSYKCDPVVGACTSTCKAVGDCGPGAACDPTGRCVLEPDVAQGHDVSCAAATGTGGGSRAWVAALVATAALGWTRRRFRASPDKRGSTGG